MSNTFGETIIDMDDMGKDVLISFTSKLFVNEVKPLHLAVSSMSLVIFYKSISF